MSNRGRCWPLLVLLALATPAWAESERDQARKLAVEGSRLLTAGACAKALERFQRAKALFPSSYKLEVNLGSARECLGDLPAAARHFEEFLKRADRSAHGDVVQGIQKKVDELRKKLGRVSVTCRIEGAEVLIDGERVGQTPLGREVYLMPGSHRLLVRRAGASAFERQILLQAGGSLEVTAAWAEPAPQSVPQAALPPPGPPGPEPPPGRPVYKRWWFWTVVGVAVLGAATAGIVASQTGGSDRLPGGTLGNIALE